VLELADPGVAAQAQQATNPSRQVIVIDCEAPDFAPHY
jgi:hypothetical protein